MDGKGLQVAKLGGPALCGGKRLCLLWTQGRFPPPL